MARFARIVIPGIPHHVIQRGNRRQQTFFSSSDYEHFLDLLSKAMAAYQVEVLAYALMPNHFHLIVVPSTERGLSRAMSEAQEAYARFKNFQRDWRGHLWQERFKSVPMDEPHLFAAARYVEMNPVRAGITASPFDYAWSSARAHKRNGNDRLVNVKPLIDRYGDWSTYLSSWDDETTLAAIRKSTNTGRPLGSEDFLNSIEELTGRLVRKRRPGPPRQEFGSSRTSPN